MDEFLFWMVVVYVAMMDAFGNHPRVYVAMRERKKWLLQRRCVLPAKPGSTPCKPIVVHALQRPTWLPGLDPPPYLDGTLAGDFGFDFDPFGLGDDDPESGECRQSWSLLARFAMAGVAGILFTDVSYTKPVSG
ncbi:hypothetical protein NC651_006135 [Populus alba x Populus x berolinensis]|nr:hypothetical protein NC651_006135 [Populus alba x Populus x berolinensis]